MKKTPLLYFLVPPEQYYTFKILTSELQNAPQDLILYAVKVPEIVAMYEKKEQQPSEKSMEEREGEKKTVEKEEEIEEEEQEKEEQKEKDKRETKKRKVETSTKAKKK